MVSKNISKRVVDLLNYKFLKMVYIPYFLNFVSIILYSSKKKRTSRLQSASQNSSSLLILVSSNPSLIFKSSIRTNNRTITNQPSRGKRRKRPFESERGRTRARRMIHLKKPRLGISLPRKVTLFVNFPTFILGRRRRRRRRNYNTRLIHPRVKTHPRSPGNMHI